MILVTGATGANGKELLRLLSARGVAVRAMVRPRPRLDEPLQGVELSTADFDDGTSVARALEGIQSAFLVTQLVGAG